LARAQSDQFSDVGKNIDRNSPALPVIASLLNPSNVRKIENKQLIGFAPSKWPPEIFTRLET
jgi:hypothetical protein